MKSAFLAGFKCAVAPVSCQRCAARPGRDPNDTHWTATPPSSPQRPQPILPFVSMRLAVADTASRWSRRCLSCPGLISRSCRLSRAATDGRPSFDGIQGLHSAGSCECPQLGRLEPAEAGLLGAVSNGFPSGTRHRGEISHLFTLRWTRRRRCGDQPRAPRTAALAPTCRQRGALGSVLPALRQAREASLLGNPRKAGTLGVGYNSFRPQEDAGGCGSPPPPCALRWGLACGTWGPCATPKYATLHIDYLGFLVCFFF